MKRQDSDHIRVFVSDKANMRASDFLPVYGGDISDGISQNALYNGLIERRISLVARLEIKDFAVAAFVEAAGAKNLAAGKVADQKQFIRRRNDKGFAVGFFML